MTKKDFENRIGKQSGGSYRVVVVEPGKAARIEYLSDLKLETLQHIVGGFIECIYNEEDAVLICNEEGKMMGLTPNRAIKNPYGDIYDVIAGTFLFAGYRYVDEIDFEEELCSLTEEQAVYLAAKYLLPIEEGEYD
jgi:hypothetical protein